jgi:squalene cyclase
MMYRSKLLFAFCLLLVTVAEARAQPEPIAIRAAAMRSLKLLETSAATYTEHRECFSCHHQALPTLAFTTAKARGFDIDEDALAHQLKHTADFLSKNRANYLKGKGQGGQADTAGYALFALHAGNWKADATTSAVVEYLLQRDKERGYWQVTSQRPPTEASSFTTTYLALAGLKHFGPDEKKQDIEARIKKSRDWLSKTKPKDTEDQVFRLRALKLTDADNQAIRSAVSELVKGQRADGGWSQLDKLDSDAYATGTVLAALHQAGGLKTSDKIYTRGVQFLLDTQKDDGSWFIRSRSKPFQLYFESGFPHTKDQWISCAGTSWATVALTLACDARPFSPR